MWKALQLTIGRDYHASFGASNSLLAFGLKYHRFILFSSLRAVWLSCFPYSYSNSLLVWRSDHRK